MEIFLAIPVLVIVVMVATYLWLKFGKADDQS
jgi:hypothetical protein